MGGEAKLANSRGLGDRICLELPSDFVHYRGSNEQSDDRKKQHCDCHQECVPDGLAVRSARYDLHVIVMNDEDDGGDKVDRREEPRQPKQQKDKREGNYKHYPESTAQL